MVCPDGTLARAQDSVGLGALADRQPELKDARGGCVPKSEHGCQALGLAGAELEKCVREVKEADCEGGAMSVVPGAEKLCKDGVDKQMKERCEKAGGTHCDDSGLVAALKDPIGTVTGEGFDGTSRKFATAAKWLAGQIGRLLFDASVIDLDSDGIADVNGPMMRLSLTVAMILLCLQVTKTCLTSDGNGFAVAATGLAKWVLTSLACYTVTQEAIWASDEISLWLISGSNYKTEAGFTLRLTQMFDSLDLVANTVVLFFIAGAACVVALALWFEMKFRHAALDLLVATSPMSAVGALSESTKEWMPAARKATITMILIKPTIVVIFLVGSQLVGQSKDLDGVVVGILVIGGGAVAWPILARFMPFSGSGAGGSVMSGLLGAVGGTAASAMWNRGGGTPSGAGAVPPGQGLAQAMEANDSAGSNRSQARSGSSRAVMAGLMAAQLAKASSDQLSGGMAAMSAHAGLGQGQDMGGTLSLPPSRGGSAGAESSAGQAGGTAAGGTDGTERPRPEPPAAAVPVAVSSAAGRHRDARLGARPEIPLGPVARRDARPNGLATPKPGTPPVPLPTAAPVAPPSVAAPPTVPAPVSLPDEPPAPGAET
ncbi:hypothetical protein CG736_34960 [Kitasatospora sp. CB02891]|nr:hypothetical protein CG736_34960 [Kitasatospora sp. CB02891]